MDPSAYRIREQAVQMPGGQDRTQDSMPADASSLTPHDQQKVSELALKKAFVCPEPQKNRYRNIMQTKFAQRAQEYTAQGKDPVLIWFQHQAFQELSKNGALARQRHQQQQHQQQQQQGGMPPNMNRTQAQALMQAVRGQMNPSLCVKLRSGAPMNAHVLVHATISKDHTGGEGARQADLLAFFGKRLHDCPSKDAPRSRKETRDYSSEQRTAAATPNGTENMPSSNVSPIQMTPQMQQQHAMNNNNVLTNPVKIQGQAVYNRRIANLAAKWGGFVENIPPEQMEAFKRNCVMEAKNQIQGVLARRRAHEAMQQQRGGNMASRGSMMMIRPLPESTSRRRHSYMAGESGSMPQSKYDSAAAAALAYQNGVSSAAEPLTAAALSKAENKSRSSRSSGSSGSRDESDFRRSATKRTTRSSTGEGEDITIKVTGQAVLRVGNAEIQCRDGGEINISQAGRLGGSDRARKKGHKSRGAKTTSCGLATNTAKAESSINNLHGAVKNHIVMAGFVRKRGPMARHSPIGRSTQSVVMAKQTAHRARAL